MTTEEIIIVAQLEAWEEEWEEFQPVDVLSPEVSGKLWDGIKKNNTSPRSRLLYFRWIAVAASVLLVIGLPWHSILRNQKTSMASAPSGITTRSIFNNTLSKMAFKLSDGSAVELLPNSTLSYPEDFNSAKRDVTLKGGANFEIAKDIAKPFTVYSNSVLTTVLGTRFTVKSYEADNTTVILHEGRVMIKIPDSFSQRNNKEFYLTPGDIFILSKAGASSRVSNAAHIATPKNMESNSPSVGSISGGTVSGGSVSSSSLPAGSLLARVIHIEKDKEDHYVFNNYPLDVVFDQLQVIYNTPVIYDKSRLGNRSFIGKIDKKDSLYTILKSIALLNNFSLRKQGDSIIIK